MKRFNSFEELLKYWSEKTPDSIAIHCETANASAANEAPLSVTFAELLGMVKSEATRLASTGCTSLGVLTDNSLACVVSVFAANMAGLQVVLLGPTTPQADLATMIQYADVDILSGPAALTDALRSALVARGTAKNTQDRVLFSTSGTTSKSKAVVLSGHSLCQSAFNGGAMLPLSEDDNMLFLLPMNHVFGFVCGVMWPLSFGASVSLGRGMRHMLDDWCFFKPTVASLVPAMVSFFTAHNCYNPELKLVLIGAGDCPDELIKKTSANGISVSFGYGLTETSSGVAISTSGDSHSFALCPDTEIEIADDGEILIKIDPCMMQGYYKKPEDTAAVLKDGILSSGDLGYLDEGGNLHVTGRKKEILVLEDGTKIYLPEYEAELRLALQSVDFATHNADGHSAPIIDDMAVLLVDKKPVLLVCGEVSPRIVETAIKPLMAEKPRGARISRIIVTDSKLPRTQTGKIQRWRLSEFVKNL